MVIISIMAGIVTSCQISDRELGEDLLPPGDDVILHHDTIFDIHAYPVTSKPYITSERSYDAERLLLLGSTQDTIVGISRASVIFQFNTNHSFTNGPNMDIDSLMLFLQAQDYVGDMTGEFTIRVYEYTEPIYRDSAYYSNFNPEGKYDTIPLVEKSFTPEDDTRLEFLIEDQEFRDKFLALGSDTTLFKSDSLFKDYFNGLYIEAESAAPGGTIARIHPAHDHTLLSLKYANDSTDIDTTAERDYKWSQFSIDEYYCQKINIFEHDFSGTTLAGIIDNDSAQSPYLYVQGMTGVNTRFSFESLEEWMERSPIAISSAKLVLNVVPEEESGIHYDDLPYRLMIGTILEDGTLESLYDHYVLASNSQGSYFGGYKKAESKGLFYDTTYVYRFNMGLHFQSMIDGKKEENNFILQLDEPYLHPEFSKLWSNLSDPKNRIRLEVAYLKL